MSTIMKMTAYVAFIVLFQACKSENLRPVTTKTSDNYNIVVLSDNGSIENGKGKFYLEFQNASNSQPMDVGNVKVHANMSMPGMPMVNDAEVTTADQPGRYAVQYDLGMAGTWTLNVSFGGNKSVTMPLTVQ